ncbi:DNA mismatch repair protein MutS [Gramella sp. GC03-9]|uniref:DNA mismatch repair protein MutS n=1 Tax=Christiangramia oceanisediminis TaxID=2920386 RepID=A0A9X2KYV6_9FLAO|nr:Smr/MutS family protein [Gramella oceanisediminis]MCP9200759.1 DNA mismatch repair protein MutS [Gramella oceanisediminis]
MDFEPGDKVELLDDELSGRVEKVNGDEVQIKTDEGFIMTFPKNELVKISDEIEDLSQEQIDLDEILKEKSVPKKPKSRPLRTKDKQQPPMEVDLHVNQLIKSSKGMSNHEILNLQLDTARHKLEFAIRKRIQRIVFIHGVGEGVLKMELEYLLGRYANVKFYDADYQKYGLGATEVYIFQNA